MSIVNERQFQILLEGGACFLGVFLAQGLSIIYEKRKRNQTLRADKIDLLSNIHHDLMYIDRDYKNIELQPDNYLVSMHTFHVLDSSISSGRYLLLNRNLQRQLDSLVIKMRLIEKLGDYVLVSRLNKIDVIRDGMKKLMMERTKDVKEMLPIIINEIEQQIASFAR